MKKLFSIILGLVLVLVFAGKVSAEKPNWNFNWPQKVDWNLSGAVMPVPPYGSMDVPGSDIKSKLMVNQPRCDTKALINGAMRGLNPDTTYTVYLSKGYTHYVFTGWNIVGTWVFRAEYYGGTYDHDLIITSQDSSGNFSGTGGYPAGGSYSITETITGTIDVMTGDITMHILYNNGYTADVVASVAPNGTISGTWGNAGQGYGNLYYSLSGNAIRTHTGDTGWPGLFTDTVQPFTFTTNDKGVGYWHLNLGKDDFPGPGTYTLSVWVNGEGATILISDNFTLNFPATVRKCWDGMRGRFDKYGNDGDHDSRDFRNFHWRMPFGWFK